MKRTGQSKIAVIGWGRGMGHQGHMYLADAVIQQAKDMNADPYFFISKTVGKDDPLLPEEKVRIYQKVFPQYATIFEPQGNLNGALTHLADLGYVGVVVVVGADQKQAFQYLEKPNKEGVPVYQTMGLKKLKVISRQETRSQFAGEEGPRATPMREILLDPHATEEEKFKVWRRDMPKELGDRDVLDIMNKAESRLVHATAKPEPKVSTKKLPKVDAMSKLKTGSLSESSGNIGLSNKVASLLYGVKPQLFTRFGDEYVMDRIEQCVEKRQPNATPTEVATEVVSSLVNELKETTQQHDLEESRIMDRDALINAFYVSPEGNKHRVAEKLPYHLLDKLVGLLTKKYNITMKDIEVRPADASQYRRTNQPELVEFAPGNSGNGGNYLKALASAWYYGTFNTGDLHKGIKSQEDVERILERGIHCGDGKVRKYNIGYNANFDGVEIQSDDHYEYSDYNDAGNDIDSRTGKPWGPYDVIAFSGKDLNESLNEFAPDEGGGSRKFIPWPEFIEQLKQILHKDFDCVENVVKTTIKARFVPHDPMEYGPTMLYSYYETRAGGRNKGAVSTRGAIQVGKYTGGGLTGQIKDKLLTTFSLLKGHPFERHFDLTFDNIYKIANIIQGNTQGALEFQPQQQGVTEDDAGDIEQRMLVKIEKLKQRLAKLKQTDPEAYKREMAKREQSRNRMPAVSTFEQQDVAEGLGDTIAKKAKQFGRYMTEPHTPHNAQVRSRAKNIANIRKKEDQKSVFEKDPEAKREFERAGGYEAGIDVMGWQVGWAAAKHAQGDTMKQAFQKLYYGGGSSFPFSERAFKLAWVAYNKHYGPEAAIEENFDAQGEDSELPVQQHTSPYEGSDDEHRYTTMFLASPISSQRFAKHIISKGGKARIGKRGQDYYVYHNMPMSKEEWRKSEQQGVTEDTSGRLPSFLSYVLANSQGQFSDIEEIEDLFDYAYLSDLDLETIADGANEEGVSAIKWATPRMAWLLKNISDKSKLAVIKPLAASWLKTVAPAIDKYVKDVLGEQGVAEATRKPRKPAAPQFTKYTNYELWERERYARGANYSETEIDGRLVGVAVVGTTYNEWGYVRDAGKVVGMWYNKASIGSFVQDGTSFDDSLSYAEQDTTWPYMDESQGVAEAEGISRRGILKGLGAAMAAGAAGKASAIAGAFPTPSHQAAMYKAAADSNRAEAKRQAELKAKADAERLQKNTDQVDKEQRINHHKLDEFAPGNGDDGLPYAEYQVYQCNPEDQFDWIGGPLYQTDNMGMAHKYAYEMYVKHRPKAFMVWQERSQGSRGNYGVKGQSDHSESDLTESTDYIDEK